MSRTSAQIGSGLGALPALLLWLAVYREGGVLLWLGLALAHALGALLLGELAHRIQRGGAAGAAWLATTYLIGAPLVVESIHRLGIEPSSGPRVLWFALSFGGLVLIFGGLSLHRTSRRVAGAATLTAALWVLWSSAFGVPIPPVELAPIERQDAPLSRIAVIGIDGADWSVLDPLLAQGELPHLGELVARGTRAELHSIDPMYSPVVWTSLFSGRRPADHGIRGWYSASARNRRVPLLWELVGAAGGHSAVSNIPGSWPPVPLRGTLVSGFPMPQLVVAEGAGGQFVGSVVSNTERGGVVPTTRWEKDGARVVLGGRQIVVPARARHPLVEAALRRRWGLGAAAVLELNVDGDPASDGPLVIQYADVSFSLARSQWSPWLDVEVFEEPAFVRIRRLAGDGLYVTPPFQDPRAPAIPFAEGADLESLFAPDGRYIVEGAGWRAAADSDLRAALAEHLEQVSALQARTAQSLAERDWDLFAFVFTLPDRIQHGYWPFHEPAAYGGIAPADVRAHGERVRDAYRRVDDELGRMLNSLGDGVTVFVVSDHGAAPDLERGVGGHRKEGVLIAAGPGIRAGARVDPLSVYDVTPTLLAGMGMPVARNMEGTMRGDLFEVPPVPRWLDAYGDLQNVGAVETIDASTEEQLRSLGYVE